MTKMVGQALKRREDPKLIRGQGNFLDDIQLHGACRDPAQPVRARPHRRNRLAIKRHIGVDDVGNPINPLIIDGQLHGGIAQGIAQALYEQGVYDENGQLLSGTLMDYAVPNAAMLRTYELDRTVTPSPVNPMGVKGAGEAGTIGSAQAIMNAVIDALAPFGVKHLQMPATPERVWRAMQAKA